MKNKITFGEFLAERRKAKGLTQGQLGQKLFVCESAVSKWESNKSKPDIEMAKELAAILGLTVDELISASIDYRRTDEKKEAKHFRTIKTAYNMFWFISFGIALLTCFIVNLAVNHTLSWFFIVFAALALASTLLIVPQYIKKDKLRWIPLLFLAGLILLLAVASIYVNGNGWFFVASCALLLGYSILFTPLLITFDKFPQIMKKHNALFAVTIDLVFLLLLLGVTNAYTNVNKITDTFWFGKLALPIVGICLIPVYATILIAKYTKLNWACKTSLYIIIWTAIANLINPIVILFGGEGGDGYFWKADFNTWITPEAINNNVHCLLVITAGLAVLLFGLTGIILTSKKKQ
ncbi:MAG: helix-turn-helix domain-containing protein [Christensenellaceae bacterium]|jgi:transcriptional regulator with XRE-family HTH domain|nr:helix-turn-helix domain-containing protein [Christensenellaceae bacterium]